jgi:hypothetical protein
MLLLLLLLRHFIQRINLMHAPRPLHLQDRHRHTLHVSQQPQQATPASNPSARSTCSASAMMRVIAWPYACEIVTGFEF